MFTLALVGRPNVGKSTLFNRLAKKKMAIVDDTPGVTRDWRETQGYLFDQSFRIIDTAGLEESFDDSIQARMRKQTEAGLEHCDAVLFMIDGRSGITPLDEHFAGWLRKQKKPVILAINKGENEKAVQSTMAESYSLGLGDPVVLSSAHGTGMEELYHALIPHFDEDEAEETDEDGNEIPENIDDLEGLEETAFDKDLSDDTDSAEEDPEKPLKIAIIGRPNVGKSTLLNAIVEDERVMTGPEAGITRDAIAVDWAFEDRKFKLVDTAGLRRKSKVTDNIEKMSAEDSMRAIRLAQVAVLVLDANAALDKQDLQIASHVIEEGRALVIALNKWDSVKNKNETLEDFKYKLGKSLSQVRDVRFVTMSALNGRNIDRLLQEILHTYSIWNRRVRTAILNRWLANMESRNPAPLYEGRPNRLKYMAQIKTRPPTFVLWVSKPDALPAAYKRYIVNGLRESFDIPAVPIRLLIRTSKNPYAK